MPVCPRCSANLPSGVQFCSTCGNSLSGMPNPPSPLNPYGATAYPGQQQTSGTAIGSLVCGILGMIILPFFASIPAVILGHISLSEIRKSAGRLQGKGMAVAGLVMGYFSVALIPFILIIAAIVIPNLLRARMASNEATAIGALRSYSSALGTYASMCPKIGFPASLANLGPGGHDCDHAQLLDSILGTESPMRSGYVFHYQVGNPDGPGQAVSFTLSADPVTEATTGMRHFFVDETGVIRVKNGGPANADSLPLN